MFLEVVSGFSLKSAVCYGLLLDLYRMIRNSRALRQFRNGCTEDPCAIIRLSDFGARPVKSQNGNSIEGEMGNQLNK
jgi:hypothetical protein